VYCIPYGVAFLLAFYISLHDFFSANPAIYFAFAKRSWWLWVYAVIFGAIAILFLLLIQAEFWMLLLKGPMEQRWKFRTVSGCIPYLRVFLQNLF
jgi:uncharacterized membrane protein